MLCALNRFSLCFTLLFTSSIAIGAEPRPIEWPALWAVWNDLNPAPVDVDALVAQQPEIRRTVDPAQRASLSDAAREAFEATLTLADRSDRFETFTNTQFSHYDTERGGAYLALFEGGRYFTIDPMRLPTTSTFSPATGQPINLYFSNEADLEFVPMDRATWQKFARSLTDRPTVTVKLVMQPVGATSDAPSFGSEAAALYLHNHVTAMEVSYGSQRNPTLIHRMEIPEVAGTRVGTLTSTGERLSAPPITAEQVAMIWQKTVGPTPPDYRLAATQTPRYRDATEFQNPDAWLPTIEADLRRRFDDFSPDGIYHMNFSTQMLPYDQQLGGFALDFTGQFFKYESVFPYEQAPPVNRAIVLPGKNYVFREHNYKLVFSNAEEISTISMSPAEGQALLERSGGSRNVAMHVVFQVESVQPPETGVAGAIDADRFVRAKAIDVRARGASTGLPLFQRSFPRPVSPPIALNVAPDVGLHPKDADVRGLKPGGKADAFMAELEAQFDRVLFDPRNPQTIIFHGKDIKGTAFVNSDYIVNSLTYNQKFDGDAIDAAAESLIKKYGTPVYDSGRIQADYGGTKRELNWTKPGVFDNKYIGVSSVIERNQAIYNGRTNMKILIMLPGNREPYRPDETTRPDIDI